MRPPGRASIFPRTCGTRRLRPARPRGHDLRDLGRFRAPGSARIAGPVAHLQAPSPEAGIASRSRRMNQVEIMARMEEETLTRL